jgi:hypothetical protein
MRPGITQSWSRSVTNSLQPASTAPKNSRTISIWSGVASAGACPAPSNSTIFVFGFLDFSALLERQTHTKSRHCAFGGFH